MDSIGPMDASAASCWCLRSLEIGERDVAERAGVVLTAWEIARLQDELTAVWHAGPVAERSDEFSGLVERQHRANFDLWHEEDKARDPEAGDGEMARVKRAIDGFNQRRNDLVEAIDVWLMERAGEQTMDAPLSSETPGLMIDRLSILALKIFHTEEETRRATATDEHRARNRERLQLLTEQREDLAGCLNRMWGEVQAGRIRFKLYRQMKMYNDPELNPKVYGRLGGQKGS